MLGIKSCKYCGAEAELFGRKKFKVVCKKCGAKGVEKPLPSMAIDSWNNGMVTQRKAGKTKGVQERL